MTYKDDKRKQSVLFQVTALLVMIVYCLSFNVMAQTSRGAVSGIVTDANGTSVAGAHVELTNKTTGVKRTTSTNKSGAYSIEAADSGTYDLTISQSGLKQFTVQGFEVSAARTVMVNAAMTPGSAQESVSGTVNDIAVNSPVRNGNIKAVSELPVADMEPISLAKTLPGVTAVEGSFVAGDGGYTTQFSVNGQRPRSNNYLLDGIDNNSMMDGGPALQLNITDAIQEVAVQTANYSSEYGRAGGGIFNVVTKSGTNGFHGTALWQHRSSALNSNDDDIINWHDNLFNATFGGPIKKDKTHFFIAAQHLSSPRYTNYIFMLPTEVGYQRLQSLAATKKNAALYLKTLGSNRATTPFMSVPLGIENGVDRGSVQFGYALTHVDNYQQDTQALGRLDHSFSSKHQLSGRYAVQDAGVDNTTVRFPGYSTNLVGRAQNIQVSDTLILGSTLTNELRFGFNRYWYNSELSGSAGTETTPEYVLSGNWRSIAMPGHDSDFPFNRSSRNFTIQEAQTKLVSRHTLRYGAEFVIQQNKIGAAYGNRGALVYTDSFLSRFGDYYNGFANFIDDYSGYGGLAIKRFNSSDYEPKPFRHSYFFQDNWKVSRSFALMLGVRYENFGEPQANVAEYPAYIGQSSSLTYKKVNPDKNNWAPSIGLAWSPSFQTGFGKALFGDQQSVIRSGYQVSYDTGYNTLMVPLQLIDAAVNTNVIYYSFPRGIPNFSTSLPTTYTPRTISPMADLIGQFDPNIRNAYTQRWSFGVQRQFSRWSALDVSYVGTVAHKLLTNSEFNYYHIVPRNGRVRRYSDMGSRLVRTGEGNSNYHAFQAMYNVNLKRSLTVRTSYTFSKFIDAQSDLIGTFQSGTDQYGTPIASIPNVLGGLRLDRGLSDFHRTHRMAISYNWAIPGPKKGLLSYPLGGWQMTGITSIQSGAPYTMLNGYDRNGDNIINDRPDIGNANAPLNTRAYASISCSTGYYNFVNGTCVNRMDVHWIVGVGQPNANTVGRNTLFTNSTSSFDVNFLKSFRITENKRLEFRAEAFNLFHQDQFTNTPIRVYAADSSENFMNLDSYFERTRTIRMQLKFIF